MGNSGPRVFLGKNLDVVQKILETCIYNIAEICWGKKEPRPGLFVTPTWCEVSDNLIHSPIHQVFPRANTAVTGVLGVEGRGGEGAGGGGRFFCDMKSQIKISN